MPKRTIPNSENMNDNANGIKQKNDPIQKTYARRQLEKYIAISLWDERMNQIREHWLWKWTKKQKGKSTI